MHQQSIDVNEAHLEQTRPGSILLMVTRMVGQGLRHGRDRTRTGTVKGTAAYMSPEQRTGREPLDRPQSSMGSVGREDRRIPAGHRRRLPGSTSTLSN